jgi:hypothetical protein
VTVSRIGAPPGGMSMTDGGTETACKLHRTNDNWAMRWERPEWDRQLAFTVTPRPFPRGLIDVSWFVVRVAPLFSTSRLRAL